MCSACFLNYMNKSMLFKLYEYDVLKHHNDSKKKGQKLFKKFCLSNNQMNFLTTKKTKNELKCLVEYNFTKYN